MTVQSKISVLWITVMLNMGFADIITFIYPGVLDQLAAGDADGITITPTFLLIMAILIEIPIAMIFLSRILRRRANRAVNLGAALITTVFIVAGGSTFPHYIFFASCEILAIGYIAYLCWQWRADEQPLATKSVTPLATSG